jgi:hypothetical protein
LLYGEEGNSRGRCLEFSASPLPAVLLLLLFLALPACGPTPTPSPDVSGGDLSEGSISEEPAPETDTETGTETDTETLLDEDDDTEQTQALAERLERITTGMWWHRDRLRDAVGLEDAQAAEMDRRCREHLRRRWALRRIERAEGTRDFAEALAAGDLGAAERAAERRRQRLAWLETADEQLKLEVLSVLRAEQLSALLAEVPGLARAPWLRPVGGRAGNGRAGNGRAGNGRAGNGRAGAAGETRERRSGAQGSGSD